MRSKKEINAERQEKQEAKMVEMVIKGANFLVLVRPGPYWMLLSSVAPIPTYMPVKFIELPAPNELDETQRRFCSFEFSNKDKSYFSAEGIRQHNKKVERYCQLAGPNIYATPVISLQSDYTCLYATSRSGSSLADTVSNPIITFGGAEGVIVTSYDLYWRGEYATVLNRCYHSNTAIVSREKTR